ncbi:hypothetical protein GCM10020358_50490 [Amorphoplanes nipponensis]|uniref:Uncharacterized protein n=1 Tax=Actinoplanes nipponensis TaxID=135950 RepID=A0A919JDN3_9ACTN|nr:hypothetical protein [Actinoplanes nipponensis]GIE47445.1 hypothetical protein Ani05nite_09790 [Actinoplanes nipponensis]
MSTLLTSVRNLVRLLVVALVVAGGTVALAEPVQAGRRSEAGVVPESAFLQPEDLGGVAGRPLTDDYAAHLRPPLPGGAERYASQASRRAQGAIAIDYRTADFHTALVEHVTTYRGAGAARYLRELRRALLPGGRTDQVGRWTVVRAGPAGRDSLLIRLQEPWTDPDGQPITHTTYVVVARAGHAVVVLADLGWEYAPGDRATVQRLICPALRRAATLRGSGA